MPKHVPSFKHLLASPATPQRQERPRSLQSVNDLLANSRINQPLPNLTADLRPGETLWTPASGIGYLDVDGGSVHPAELARRREVERRRARRGVAGPAPPPSWANQASNHVPVGTINAAPSPDLAGPSYDTFELVTAAQLRQSSLLFSQHRPIDSIPIPTLVESCLCTVLRYLNDHTVVSEPNLVDQDTQNDVSGWTFGALLAEQIPYLDTHLKVQLLDCHSLLPEGSPDRLTDQSILSILAASSEDDAGASTDVMREDVHEGEDAAQEDSSADVMSLDGEPEPATDWDQPTTSTSIRRLPLTLHSSPLSLLRRINTLHSVPLTSLNLAYSTIPNLERLVGILSVGLRELGLCGIRIGRGEHKQQAIESWRRGLSALGRKMIVLRMLDLSESPYPIIQQHLTALLFPSSRLPSLRLLSLRGSVDTEIISVNQSRPRTDTHRQAAIRSDLLEVIKGRSKERYVQVVWS